MRTPEYIHERINPGRDDHWLWAMSLNNAGYGNAIDEEGNRCGAHVLSYRIFNGPIPQGMMVDHRKGCPRHCVNPKHLTAVTRDVNSQLAWRRKKGQWGRRDLRVARLIHRWVSDRINERASI